jgi:glycosyltransferase involved in cell wall biosynthesis
MSPPEKDQTHFVVGVPTYNNADTIERTIEVFENQSVPPTELIFCDASTDRTPEIIRQKASTVNDFEITLLEQEGEGVADAYNQILDSLDGEYDVFGTLQTDFKVDEDWVENAIHLHEERPQSDIINAHTGIHRELDPTEPPYFSGRCFTAKAGVLERVGGWDENFLRGEDWDIRIRLAGAGVTAFGTEQLDYESFSEDPPITLRKAMRKPTSATFLAKYGPWYAMYHPSHIVADGLSALAVLGILLAVVVPPYGLALAMMASGAYLTGHNLVMGDVHGSRVVGVIRKQFLDGIGFFTTIARIVGKRPDWNRTGFNPENIPSQGI